MNDSSGEPGRRAQQRIVEAIAVPEGEWWEVTVPELRLSTSTRDRGMIEAHARSLAAAALGIPPRNVAVTVRIDDGPGTA